SFHRQDAMRGAVLRSFLPEPPLDREGRRRDDRDVGAPGRQRDDRAQRRSILQRRDEHDEAVAWEEARQHPGHVGDRPFSARADAFQLSRRTSSPGTYSRIPQKSVPTPMRRDGTWPNHGRVRRGWRRARRRSSIAGATTRRESSGTTASSAPRASGSRERTRTGPRWKSPFTADRTSY